MGSKNQNTTITLILMLLLVIAPFVFSPMPIYAQSQSGKSPIHSDSPVHRDPSVYVNGTWYEGDNATTGAPYRDWHAIQWQFKEFTLRNWSQNITKWDSGAHEWGVFIDTVVPVKVNVTLPIPINLTYKDGTVQSLQAGETLEFPAGSAIQSYYTMGNLGGGVCVVYPDTGTLAYSNNQTGVFNETQPKNFLVEGYLNGKFYRSDVTYQNSSEGKVISWYTGYKGCSSICHTLHKENGGEYDPNPKNVTFQFDIQFNIHILHTANYTKIKSDVEINITRLTLPGMPKNATFGIVLRFSHFVKPVLPGGNPAITVNGKDFVFSPEIVGNATAAYKLGKMEIIDFELPKKFTLYTSDGKNRTLNIASAIGWDSSAEHPCWSSYMYFDVGFFGLPYGDTVNTTRIVYDPTIIIYHIPEKTDMIRILIPVFTVIAAAVLIAVYVMKVRKPRKTEVVTQDT